MTRLSCLNRLDTSIPFSFPFLVTKQFYKLLFENVLIMVLFVDLNLKDSAESILVLSEHSNNLLVY